jgi:hypothetical protein
MGAAAPPVTGSHEVLPSDAYTISLYLQCINSVN